MSKSTRTPKQRADQLLVERGLAPSRSRAQALILAGEVFSGDRRIDKAGQQLEVDLPLRVRERQKYVSRGGLKLEGALSDMSFDPGGLVAADIGASTGGFTDCLLEGGARRVYAIDVGKGQLAEKLRRDDRVVVMEKTNARHLAGADLGEHVDLVVVDASFIGLSKLLDGIMAISKPGAHLLALIKPQFEVGRQAASKARGVIADANVRQAAIDQVLRQLEARGFAIVEDHSCRVPGPKGNVEHFVLARYDAPSEKAASP